MPSKARISFDKNLGDVERLLALHTMVEGQRQGRRYGLEVLNKSAITSITAFWEAYCENIAAEALEHIVKYAKSSDALPKELKKQLAKELKGALHELETWKIADDGWRKYLNDRLSKLKELRNWDLNTPKSDQIDKLFLQAIGIPKISSAWHWPKKMTVQRAAAKL